MTSPIIYKSIPTQYAFFTEDDGTKLDGMKFKDKKEARKYIKNLKEVL